MNWYEVTIHHRDLAALDDLEWLKDALATHLLATVRMLARSEKEAAAKAWVRCVGLERERILLDLQAPHAVLQGETDISYVASALKDCDVWCGQYVFDVLFEAWYFRVEPIADTGDRTSL